MYVIKGSDDLRISFVEYLDIVILATGRQQIPIVRADIN